MRKALGDRAVANLFLIPSLTLLIAFNVFPLFWSLYLSFTNYHAGSPIAPVWVGGANYTDLFTDPDKWQVFVRTARLVGLSVFAQFVVGFGIALLLNRQFRAKGLVTTAFLLPMMLSPVLVGVFWRFLLEPQWGLMTVVYSVFGAQYTGWLTDPNMAFWSLVIADTWMWAPFIMLVSLAGLSSVPKHLYEAAEVDRASYWFKFRYITIPFITPLLLVALLLRTMDCFKFFDMVKVMTDGGPGAATETVAVQLYRMAFSRTDTGMSCALAYIVLVMIIGLANVYIKALNRARGEGPADSRPLFSLPDTKWMSFVQSWWPVGFFAIVVIWNWTSVLGLLSVAASMPIVSLSLVAIVIVCVLGGSVARHYLSYVGIAAILAIFLIPLYWITATSLKKQEDIVALPPKVTFAPTMEQYKKLVAGGSSGTAGSYLRQVGNSAIVGVSSTILAVSLGAMAAYALARFRVKGKNDWLFFILSTRMLPPVVVAIPIFLMFTSIGLRNTYTGLSLLYTVFNLSLAVWLLKGFFEEVPRDYEDAALLDGYSRLRAFWHVTLPQVLPGIAATTIFCFISAWNEFAFALILMDRKQSYTAPVGLQGLAIGAQGFEWGVIAAGTLLFLLPVAIFTFLLRNQLLRGVTFGAIKR